MITAMIEKALSEPIDWTRLAGEAMAALGTALEDLDRMIMAVTVRRQRSMRTFTDHRLMSARVFRLEHVFPQTSIVMAGRAR